ncbi:hypothetical protein [Vibrio mangrovi]|uniref:Uncharacterized protein n=1 Tax=Vibrio mangrovi TaxID=474394 RepID=A0A1Y6IT01_9VIBR|nr:hypothetical protein [Vibrio mangrovi]MDW6004000.1 hypothetical protein [Vibrio mangrovi]SMR99203.1 hypothetical protein VIM7927_00427 [Vibrio mangrovi]
MEFVFLPLIIVLFQWRNFESAEWGFTAFYLVYAVLLVTNSEIPTNSRIGSFYLGIPSAAYVTFIFPELYTRYSERAMRVLSVIGLLVAFVALISIF